MPTLTFTNPIAFSLLLPLGLALGVALSRRPPTLPIPTLPANPPRFTHRLPPTAILLALLLLIASAATPTLTWIHLASRPASTHLLIALDVSGSMQAVEPFPDGAAPGPSRLEAARHELLQLLDHRLADTYGLIGFAGSAYLIAPLSPYPDLLRERLTTLDTDDFDDGTAIGAAITAATIALEAAPAGSRRIILLVSDGVDHTQSPPLPAAAARRAAAAGIHLFCIGLGGDQAWHPVPTPNGLRWQPAGEPTDWTQLRHLAAIGQGACFTADALPALPALFQHLQTTLPSPPISVLQPHTLPLTAPLALLSLTLLTLSLVPWRPWRLGG